MQITEVFTPPQILRVHELACEIWNEHYPSIISQQQVDYMLQKFQSPQVILEQINARYRYYLLGDKEDVYGYMAVQQQRNTLFISKLYIQKEQRKKGYAKAALAFLCTLAQKQGVSRLSLTVNIRNTIAIKSYESLGFINTGTQLQDIGEGYLMDDFTFEYQC